MKMNKVNHSYQSYNCADGIANVNIFNGNLLFEYPLVSTGMNSFEISTSLVYNSDYKSTDFNGRLIGMGNGWKLNIEQHLFRYESSFNLEGFTEDDYVYIDSNWNIHKFVKYYPNDDTTYPRYYYDESGTGLRLTINSIDIIEIKDSLNNIYRFNDKGRLKTIISSINDSITKQIEYDEYMNIVYICDTRKQCRKIKFEYDGKLINKAYCLKQNTNYVFNYKDCNLFEIYKQAIEIVDEVEKLYSKKLMTFLYNGNNLINFFISNSDLLGIKCEYADDKLTSISSGAILLTTESEEIESELYLELDSQYQIKYSNENNNKIENYLLDKGYKYKESIYSMPEEYIRNENNYTYYGIYSEINNKDNIKYRYYFDKKETIISCLQVDINNNLFTTFRNNGWNLSKNNGNYEVEINGEKATLLQNGEFCYNVSSNQLRKFNELFKEDSNNDDINDNKYEEHFKISFWLNYLDFSDDHNLTMPTIEFSIDNVEGTKKVKSNINLTEKNIWQFISIPIDLGETPDKISDLKIIFYGEEEDTKILLSNVYIEKGSLMKIYLTDNEENEYSIDIGDKIFIDNECYTISSTLFFTENDLFETYKNIYLKNGDNKFDVVYNNGTKVKKAQNICLLKNNKQINFSLNNNNVPNYKLKLRNITDGHQWVINENYLSFYKVNIEGVLKNTFTKVYTTLIYEENSFSYLYLKNETKIKNKYYFDGLLIETVKETKEIDEYNSVHENGLFNYKYNVITKENKYDYYGNLVEINVYPNGLIDKKIIIEQNTYCDDDQREAPLSIMNNGILYNLLFNCENQSLLSSFNTNMKQEYIYDQYNENIIYINNYDSTGNLYSFIQNYYLVNNLLSRIYSPNSENYSFSYDIYGKMHKIYKNNKTELIKDFDEIKYNNNTIITDKTYYTNNPKCINYIYDSNKKLVEINDNLNKVIFEYEDINNVSNELKRLVKIVDNFSSKNYLYSYTEENGIFTKESIIENELEIKESSNNKIEYKILDNDEIILTEYIELPSLHKTEMILNMYKENNEADKKMLNEFTYTYMYDEFDRVCKKNQQQYTYDGNHEVPLFHNININKEIEYKENSNFLNKYNYQFNLDLVDGANLCILSHNEVTLTSENTLYDDRGNVKKCNIKGNRFMEMPNDSSQTIGDIYDVYYEFKYDDFNRIKEESAWHNGNYIINDNYEYDQSGMISKIKNGTSIKKEFINTDGRLTKYKKNDSIEYEIKYDNYGNIIKIGNDVLEYNGRGLLNKVSQNLSETINHTIESSYNYDYQGLRTIKRVHESYEGMLDNEYSCNYYYYNDKLIAEDKKDLYGNTIYRFKYFYDLDGICGIRYNDNNYTFIRDTLGNVCAIVHFGKLIGQYVYDAWGNCTKHSSENLTYDESIVFNYNPFRYKGYYYDVETQLYWVSSRYYSPELCRWISPDSIEYLDPQSINGLNLYAYCGNDPINKYDPTGHFAITLTTLLIGGLIAGAIGAGIGLGTAVYKDVKEDGVWFNGDWTDYVGRTLGGFVAGFGVGICTVLGAGVGAAALGGTTATLFTSTGLTLSLGSALGIGSGVAFATGMAGYAVRTGISRSEDFKVQNMFIEGGFNAVSGALSVLGGYLGGMAGVHNTVFTKLLSQKGDFWLRLLVENVFTAGFKLTNALIKPYFMI